MTKIKRGTMFLHAQWLDEDGSPLRCVVTSTRYGCVYWRRADTAGGASTCFRVEEIARRVKSWLP